MAEFDPRGVRRSPQFDAQAESLEPNLERLDEALRGIEWALARSPRTGTVFVEVTLGASGPLVKVTALVSDELATLSAIELIAPADGSEFD